MVNESLSITAKQLSIVPSMESLTKILAENQLPTNDYTKSIINLRISNKKDEACGNN